MFQHLVKYISSKRYVLTLAIPLILSNLTVPLLGLTNVTIAGHLSNHVYLSALGLGVMIFDFLYWMFAFFRMGTTGLLANAYGAKDSGLMMEIITHSLGCALLLGIILIFIGYALAPWLMETIPSSKEIITLTKSYFYVRILAAPAVLANYVFIGVFIGLQKTRKTLLLMLFVNVGSVFFALLLTQVWHLALTGIAIADVTAQYLGATYGLITALSILRCDYSFGSIQINKKTILALLHCNSDIFIRTLCSVIAFSFFTWQSSALGGQTLAVNTVLLQFLVLFAFAQDGFANVTETLIGERIGAQDAVGSLLAFKDTFIWSLALAIMFFILYVLLGSHLIDILTAFPEVRAKSKTFLIYACAIPIISMGCFFLDGAYIGANQFKEMRNMSCLSLAGYFLIWAITKSEGNHGLWLTFLGFFFLRTAMMGLRFCSVEFRSRFFPK